MRLKIDKPLDGRKRGFAGVIDLDTGQEIGYVETNKADAFDPNPLPLFDVRLFGSKYNGRFETPEGCEGFVAGVAAVFSHATSTVDVEAEVRAMFEDRAA